MDNSCSRITFSTFIYSYPASTCAFIATELLNANLLLINSTPTYPQNWYSIKLINIHISFKDPSLSIPISFRKIQMQLCNYNKKYKSWVQKKIVFSHGSLVLSANRHGPWLLKLPTHLILKPKESLKQQKSACAWDETSLQKPKVAFQTAREKGSRKRGNPLPVRSSCKKAKQLSKKKTPMWLHPCRRVLCKK